MPLIEPDMGANMAVRKRLFLYLILSLTAASAVANDKSKWWTKDVEAVFIDCSVLSIDESIYPTIGWKSSQTRPLEPKFNEALCKAIGNDIDINRVALGLPDSTAIVLSLGLNQLGIAKYQSQTEIDRLTDAAIMRKNKRSLAYLAQQQAFLDDLPSVPKLISPATYDSFDSLVEWRKGRSEKWETEISSHIMISVEGFGIDRQTPIEKSMSIRDRIGKVSVIFNAKNSYFLRAGGNKANTKNMAELTLAIRRTVYQSLLRKPPIQHLPSAQREKLEAL